MRICKLRKEEGRLGISTFNEVKATCDGEKGRRPVGETPGQSGFAEIKVEKTMEKRVLN